MWQRVREFFRLTGPGIITGAADDDPSGIATYSQAGAEFGYMQLWMMVVMLPMMIAVQEMCARVGVTTGRGVAGVLKDNYSPVILYLALVLMIVANIANLGADLGAMAAATRLLVDVPYATLTAAFAVISLLLEIFVPYRVYSGYLKWLAFSLLAYVATGIIVTHDWGQVLRATFVPHIRLSRDFLLLTAALLGTTISPYLFFWQPAQVVEEQVQRGLLPRYRRPRRRGPLPNVTWEDLREVRIGTVVGMLSSQGAAWFVMVTAAGSLHPAGVTDIVTASQAASALRPLTHSPAAEMIFTLGIVGLGLIAVPTFAGSLSYALAETFGWRSGLYFRPFRAVQFYGIIAISTLLGLSIDALKINPMKALIYAAVLNGLIAVPLILLVILATSNRDVMGRYVNGIWSRFFGWATFAAMAAAVVMMVVRVIGF